MDSLLPPLPAFRGDLEVIGREDSPPKYLIVDSLLRQKLSVDALSKEIIDRLIKSKQLNDLVSVHGVAPVFRRVVFLAQRGLLEGVRYQHNLAILQALPSFNPDRTTMPFVFEAGLKHACQACGSCCSATDVGPIAEAHVNAILAHDWRNHISQLESNESVFRYEQLGEQSIVLTAMREDRCIFLGTDNLCQVHKKLGPQAKPTPCRQFPYQFAEADGQIFVSLQMECRAHWKASQAAEPTASKEQELRDLMAEGAPVHHSPRTVSVDSGFHISMTDYLRLETQLILAIRQAPVLKDGTGPMVAFAQCADELLTDLYANIDRDERYRDPASWPEMGPEIDSWESFFSTVGCLETELVDFCSQAEEVALQRSLNSLVQRFARLKHTSLAACSTLDPQSFCYSEPEKVHSIVSDLLVSALFGKESLRRSDLRYGLARIGMRVWFTLAGACQRAKEGCRAHVVTQDVIDSMVTMSKMLRERAVEELFETQKSSIISVFLTNLGVFTKTAPPRQNGPGGIG